MNVGELREILKNLPEDMRICMSSDEEGNRVSYLSEIDTHTIVISEDFYYELETVDDRWSAKDANMEDEKWAKILKRNRVLMLWP